MASRGMHLKPQVKLFSFGWVAFLAFAFAPCVHASSSDDPNPPVVALGDNTYVITRGSSFRYFLGTAKLVLRARADAQKFCHDQGKEMRELSVEEIKGSVLLGDFSKAKITFKALAPGDPGLSATDAPAGGSDLTKLEELHHSGVLVDSEFDAAKKRLAAHANAHALEELQDLHSKGVLSDSEFEAARKRLDER